MQWEKIADIIIGLCLALLLALTVSHLLTGCTTASYQEQQAQAAAVKGCYCEASNCEQLTAAAGQAAVAAAGGKVVQITEIRRTQPNEAAE